MDQKIDNLNGDMVDSAPDIGAEVNTFSPFVWISEVSLWTICGLSWGPMLLNFVFFIGGPRRFPMPSEIFPFEAFGFNDFIHIIIARVLLFLGLAFTAFIRLSGCKFSKRYNILILVIAAAVTMFAIAAEFGLYVMIQALR